MRTGVPISLQRPLFATIAGSRFGVRDEDVEACLREQRQSGGRLGGLLRRRGLITREQLGQVLREQARSVAGAVHGERPGVGLPYDTFLSLCMPAYNEAANIEDTLDAACAILPEFVRRFEIVVVDDGSQDDTANVIARYAEQESRVRLLRHAENRGYGAAVTTGLRAAQGDLVAYTDSDGQLSFLDLAQLLSLLPVSDGVVGYRYRRADNWVRRFNAWGWNSLIRAVLGVRVHDLDCGFKLFPRHVIERLALTATGSAISAEILAQCTRWGLRIRQVPVSHYPRYQGVATGADLKVIYRAFRELIGLLRYRARSARARPRPAAPAADPKLTICMVAPCPFPANYGTPGSIREMAEAVADRGHDVDVVTYPVGDGTPVRGPRVHRIPPWTGESAVVVGPTSRRPLYDLLLVFKTLAVIRETRPDLIHAHGYEALLVANLCRLVTGLPIVYSGHNTMGDELSSYNFIRPRWLAVALARFLDSAVPRLGDCCLPHSTNMERFFRGTGLAGRTEPTVPFGIDLDGLDRGDAAAVRRRYPLGRGPVILYTGLLDRFQRLDLLLEALQTILFHEPEARLLIVIGVANARDLAAVRERAAQLGVAGQVILTEPQPLSALGDFLAAADVAVVPRPQIPGFPIKLLNYLAARKPCVLFASSASGGLVHEDGAFLVDRETGTDLAAGVLEVLRDDELRERLAQNGYEFVRRHHDRRLVAQQLCAVYRRTLARAGRTLLPGRPRSTPVDLLSLVARSTIGRDGRNGVAHDSSAVEHPVQPQMAEAPG